MPTAKKKPAQNKPAARAAKRPTPRPPAALNPMSLPGPETITRRELAEGIVVLVRENHASPSVVIDADLRAGSLWESRAQAGLSNFAASAMMRGTESRSFAEIYEAIESVGATLSVSSGTHTSGFSGKSLAEDLGLLLELAADSLRRPTFPADQVERLRGELLTRMAVRDNNTHARAEEAFFETAYAGHPYAIDEDGYPDTVRALTREDLANFHRVHFGPRGMSVTLVGDVQAEAAVALVERYFGDWANPQQPPEPALPPVTPLAGATTRRVLMPGKIQNDLVLGGPGPARRHPKFLAARLANNILGVFGMGGRIGHYVRERGGMAYYAASGLDGGLGPGAWRAYAGVNPKNVDRAVELMLTEIKKFTSRRVTPDELASNKTFFLGRLPLSLETNEGVASAIGSLELYDLGLDYFQHYPAMVGAITRDDIQEVAAEFLSAENYVLAIAGP
ncbi:MAG: pitrilysin family protein [Anaerolineales bacterium]